MADTPGPAPPAPAPADAIDPEDTRPLLELVRAALERPKDRVAHAAALVAVDNVLAGWTPGFAADWMRGFLARAADPPAAYVPPALPSPYTTIAPRRHHDHTRP
jgi:hypothetical protein